MVTVRFAILDGGRVWLLIKDASPTSDSID
jgi:hypothetical protein